MNVSRYAYEGVNSHMSIAGNCEALREGIEIDVTHVNDVTHINELLHTHELVTSHRYMRCAYT